VKRVATEEKGNGENRNDVKGKKRERFEWIKEDADIGGEGKDGDDGKIREREIIGRREKESNIMRKKERRGRRRDQIKRGREERSKRVGEDG
jgi:hypothetical protein